MELALSLGDRVNITPKPPLTFLDKKTDLGFCMGLGLPLIDGSRSQGGGEEEEEKSGSSDPPVQLDLLPSTPVQPQASHQLPFPWLTANLLSEPAGSSNGPGRETEVNRRQWAAEEGGDGAAQSSPNSTTFSTFQQMDLSIYKRGIRGKRDLEGTSVIYNEVDTDHQRGGCASNSRTSDEEENNGLNRKKLRLSKEQSAFLEESFKEHNTLNPKQKLALAKQLNLRPRQVEVWFQNRRARTKLKQTEVDCEYLKRWCETLTEENRRLTKELQELRALKTSQPFYMQHPATTLTMCPSCERVASTTTTTTNAATTTPTPTTTTTTDNTELVLANSRLLHPFKNYQAHAQQAGS